MSYFEYEFTAELERFGVGKSRKVWYHVLFVPKDLAQDLPLKQYPRLRVAGEIADVPIQNALIPAGDGRHYVIVSPNVIKSADLALGDLADMRFTIADQDSVDLPEALQNALEADETFASLWNALTPGKKRGMCHHVQTAKTEPTRAKRVAEVIETTTEFDGNMRAFLDHRKQAKKRDS